MPPVVAAVAVALGVSTAMATVIVVSAVIMIASIAYSAYQMATMPDMPGYSAEVRGRTQVVRSAVTPHRIIYGQVMVSGPLVAAFSCGDNNKYIYLVIVLAAHEVEEIGDVYFGDTLATDEKFTTNVAVTGETHTIASGIITLDHVPVADPTPVLEWFDNGPPSLWVVLDPSEYSIAGAVVTFTGPSIGNGTDIRTRYTYNRPLWQVTKYLGTTTQAADPDLIADAVDVDGNPAWTSAHQLKGRAYIVVKLEYLVIGSEVQGFPQGIPNIKAVVKGVNNIYDPRTETSGYTTNWALCCRDYLVKSYGLKCDSTDINDAFFIAAANICDEDMALYPSGTEKRYTANGCFNLDGKPVDIMKKLLTGAVGQMVWSQGQYSIFPAAYNTPVARPLTESDLRSNISVLPAPSRKDKINTVRGTFVNPDQFWQQMDFPVVQLASALAIDGGELVDNIELPYTTSGTTAQRLATIHLNKKLLGVTVTFPGKLTCFRYQPQDVVPVTIAQLGWSNKLFRVTNWGLSDDGGVDLVLREEDPDVYGWTSTQAQNYVYPPVALIDWPPTLILPAPTGVTATGGANQIELEWVSVVGATSYNIYWSTVSGVTKDNGTKIALLTSPYTLTGLDAETEYFFVVTAFDGARESADSEQATATTDT